MPAQVKEMLRQLFHYQCGYCGVREVDVGSELTIDHFQPRSRGGSDELRNLVYSCHACNEFKGDFWSRGSPQILHPLEDDLSQHFLEAAEGTLLPLTASGSLHIERLRLNRPQLVEFRLERRQLEAARQAEKRLLDRLSSLDLKLKIALEEIERLKHENFE
jgi:hypothetical protein